MNSGGQVNSAGENRGKSGPVIFPPPILQPLIPGRDPSRYEATESEVKAHEDRVADTKDFSMTRDLAKSNLVIGQARFFEIERRVRYRLAQLPPDEPLRILTIGPGVGNMEGELKGFYGDRIVIDTFSLTARLWPANRAAIRDEYLGNIDFSRLPRGVGGAGYDLIMSVHGTFWAQDPLFAAQQIYDSLAVGGEASFTISRADEPLLRRLSDLTHDTRLFDAMIRSGLYVYLNGMGLLYIEKRQDVPVSLESLLSAQHQDQDWHWFYQETRTGPWKITRDVGLMIDRAAEEFLSELRKRGLVISESGLKRYLQAVWSACRNLNIPIDEALRYEVAELVDRVSYLNWSRPRIKTAVLTTQNPSIRLDLSQRASEVLVLKNGDSYSVWTAGDAGGDVFIDLRDGQTVEIANIVIERDGSQISYYPRSLNDQSGPSGSSGSLPPHGSGPAPQSNGGYQAITAASDYMITYVGSEADQIYAARSEEAEDAAAAEDFGDDQAAIDDFAVNGFATGAAEFSGVPAGI